MLKISDGIEKHQINVENLDEPTYSCNDETKLDGNLGSWLECF